MIGAPPNCKPECVVNSDCSSNKACHNQRCKDPCINACGSYSVCRVQNHLATCECAEGYTGNSFEGCFKIIETQPLDPCNPSPCGKNAVCNNGQCSCYPEYRGDPYNECRPECVLSTECSPNKACIRNKCVDPCIGICGQGAECSVFNHIPTCNCPQGRTGDPFVQCKSYEPVTVQNPCNPSPCGPNSQCREINDRAVCTCLPNMIGSPPSCRPECLLDIECDLSQSCQQQKCIDPCPGVCGHNAQCRVVNHYPICHCQEGYTGNPTVRCSPVEKDVTPIVPLNPCNPSPCGENAECRVVGDYHACSCLPLMKGVPPNCRPECLINTECSSYQACINKKCQDPCPGSCGINTECSVINHTPVCSCTVGYTGDPFRICEKIKGESISFIFIFEIRKAYNLQKILFQ